MIFLRLSNPSSTPLPNPFPPVPNTARKKNTTHVYTRTQELRDSAKESDANAERFEAAAAEAERQAEQLRLELHAAREEMSATRSAVEAGDGRVVSLSEEVQTLRQARNRLDLRREELQLELAGEKLKGAFGVGRSTGLGLGAGPGAVAAGGPAVGEVFQRWRLAFLEARHGSLRIESEANRGKADSYESLVQRLSEELERQGEAVNRHAGLLRQRDEELDAALDRAARAHEELISLEPPSLSQAVGGVKILLRVSAAAGATTGEQGEAAATDGDEADGGGVKSKATPKLWCLVRYNIASSSGKGRSMPAEQGEEKPTGSAEVDGGGEGEREQGAAEGVASTPRGNRPSAETAPPLAEGGGEVREPSSEAVEESAASPSASNGDAAVEGDGSAAAAEPVQQSPDPAHEEEEEEEEETAEKDSEDEIAPVEEGESAAGVAAATIEVVEWRTQEDVDEWFALELARAVELAEASAEARDGGGGAAGAMDLAVAQTPAPQAPALPVLDMPVTLQESFAAELGRVRGELEGRLEEARAELRRNTEAYKQYRARVRREAFFFLSLVLSCAGVLI